MKGCAVSKTIPSVISLTSQQRSVLETLPSKSRALSPLLITEVAAAVELTARAALNIIDDLVARGLAEVHDVAAEDKGWARWNEPLTANRTIAGDFNVGEVIAIEEARPGHEVPGWKVTMPPRAKREQWTVEYVADRAAARKRAKVVAAGYFNGITLVEVDGWRLKPICIVPPKPADSSEKPRGPVFFRYEKAKRTNNCAHDLTETPDYRSRLGVRDFPVMTVEDFGLLEDQHQVFRNIDKLVEVDESFRDLLRFLILRIVGNKYERLFCYQIAQLSELGTGFSSSWHNGGVQSDRRDDVVLSFITTMCGQSLNLRLRGDELCLRGGTDDVYRYKNHYVRLPLLSYENREKSAAKIDRLVDRWHYGKYYSKLGARVSEES